MPCLTDLICLCCFGREVWRTELVLTSTLLFVWTWTLKNFTVCLSVCLSYVDETASCKRAATDFFNVKINKWIRSRFELKQTISKWSTTNWTRVPKPNDIWPNASLSPLWCFIKELIHSFPNTTHMQEVSCQINQISNQQKPPDKEQPRDFKCAVTVMEILNKLWAVFACLLQYTLICCLFCFK